MIPVILSGGSGSRLWPLSRKLYPKQFLALTGEHSLFQQTLQRLSFELAQLEGRPLSAARREALRRLASAQPADLRLRPICQPCLW